MSIGPAVVAPYYCIVVGRPTSQVCGSFSIFALPVSVIEYYNAALDHYFYSASAPDVGALDTGQFNACVDSRKYQAEIDKDILAGTEAGVSGTPAFFINGRMLSGAQPFDAFKRVIDEELARKK